MNEEDIAYYRQMVVDHMVEHEDIVINTLLDEIERLRRCLLDMKVLPFRANLPDKALAETLLQIVDWALEDNLNGTRYDA